MLQKKYNRPFIIALMLGILLASPLAAAYQEPQPIAGDPRIRTYVYEPNEVYSYTGHYKYASIIQFDNNENIDSISLGDPSGWQIVQSGSRMFIKPIEQNATTNMTIFTDKRIYFFELYAEQAEEIRDEEVIFMVKFIYPDSPGDSASFRQFTVKEEVPAAAAGTPLDPAVIEQQKKAGRFTAIPDTERNPEKYNFDYTLTGSRLIAPIKVFDDGEFTYMEFRRINADIPAIFAVTSTGDEALINFRASGNYIIIEEVGKQFTLRSGADVACLFNESDPLKRADIDQDKSEKFLGIF